MLPSIREVIDSLMGRSNKLFPNNKEAIGFQWFGLRQPDYSKKCGCKPLEGTLESPTCSRCLNIGYLFTDYLVKGYMWLGVLGSEYNAIPGLISTQQKNVIVEHNRPINVYDFILELDQDPTTNKLKQPFRITKYMRIQDSIAIKGDDSRIEFWKCTIEQKNVEDGKSPNIGTSYSYGGNRSNAAPE